MLPLLNSISKRILAPSLTAGPIVIMDNLAAHKGKRIEKLIKAKGGQVLFLPGDSPDFSPIEEAFSKLKTHLRRIGPAHVKHCKKPLVKPY